MVGMEAINHLLDGRTTGMLALVRHPDAPYQVTTSLVEFSQVAGLEKPLPQTFINNEGNMMTPDFWRYAQPLIGQPLPPVVRRTH